LWILDFGFWIFEVTERLSSIRSKINNRSSSIVNPTACADGGEGTSNIERPTSSVEVESSPAAGWPMVGDDSERDAPWDGLRRDAGATWAGFHSRVDRVEGA
jgi:hypothetical protein